MKGMHVEPTKKVVPIHGTVTKNGPMKPTVRYPAVTGKAPQAK